MEPVCLEAISRHMKVKTAIKITESTCLPDCLELWLRREKQ